MNKKKPLKVYDLKPGHTYFLVVDPTMVNQESLRSAYKQLQKKGVHLFVSFVKDVEKAMKFLPNPGEEAAATDTK